MSDTKFQELIEKGLDKHGVYTEFVIGNPAHTAAKFYYTEARDLFVAAPEMLEVLEELVKWDNDYYEFNLIIEKAKNIIAKAKGETNNE